MSAEQPPIDDVQAEFLDNLIASQAGQRYVTNPESENPAYHVRPARFPEQEARTEYANWVRNGRQLGEQAVDHETLEAMNPLKAQERAQEEAKRGEYL